MDAGVALKGAVAGIAMGLVKEGDQYAILTDIAGAEDHYGDMDFKVAGTRKGITAMQMDIKIPGITGQIMREAMEQARHGRLFLLDKMDAELQGARETRSKFAPRIHTLQIPTDKIRDLIGPGGKVIRGIIEATGVKIDVDDTGRVNVASSDEVGLDQGSGDDQRPDRSAGGREDLPGQGCPAGGVRSLHRNLPGDRWFAAYQRDRRASREGCEGRIARGRPGDGEGSRHRGQSHQAIPQGAP